MAIHGLPLRVPTKVKLRRVTPCQQKQVLAGIPRQRIRYAVYCFTLLDCRWPAAARCSLLLPRRGDEDTCKAHTTCTASGWASMVLCHADCCCDMLCFSSTRRTYLLHMPVQFRKSTVRHQVADTVCSRSSSSDRFCLIHNQF